MRLRRWAQPHYLLRRGFDIWGTDRDENALASARATAATLAPLLPADRFRGWNR
jgi:hypothetical protein